MKSRYITPQIFVEEIEDNLLQTLSRTGVNTTNVATDNGEIHGSDLQGSGPGTNDEEWADSKGGSIIWDWDDE